MTKDTFTMPSGQTRERGHGWTRVVVTSEPSGCHGATWHDATCKHREPVQAGDAMHVVAFQTTHFLFDAAGDTRDEAMQALREVVAGHLEATDADPDYFAELMNDPDGLEWRTFVAGKGEVR